MRNKKKNSTFCTSQILIFISAAAQRSISVEDFHDQSDQPKYNDIIPPVLLFSVRNEAVWWDKKKGKSADSASSSSAPLSPIIKLPSINTAAFFFLHAQQVVILFVDQLRRYIENPLSFRRSAFALEQDA